MHEISRICGNESQPGLQLVKILAVPLWKPVIFSIPSLALLADTCFDFKRVLTFSSELQKNLNSSWVSSSYILLARTTCCSSQSPFSDQTSIVFSPNNIHMFSREMVLRVDEMITKEKSFDLFTNSPN